MPEAAADAVAGVAEVLTQIAGPHRLGHLLPSGPAHAAEVAFEAMRILGGNGYSKDFPVERYYRDAPLVVIGGGTNELQRLIIARNLLKKYKDNG